METSDCKRQQNIFITAPSTLKCPSLTYESTNGNMQLKCQVEYLHPIQILLLNIINIALYIVISQLTN